MSCRSYCLSEFLFGMFTHLWYDFNIDVAIKCCEHPCITEGPPYSLPVNLFQLRTKLVWLILFRAHFPIISGLFLSTDACYDDLTKSPFLLIIYDDVDLKSKIKKIPSIAEGTYWLVQILKKFAKYTLYAISWWINIMFRWRYKGS